MKLFTLKSFGFLLIFPAMLFSYSCGKGGAGVGLSGGGNPATAPPDTILSGSVQAPNGQIAFLGKSSLFKDFAEIVIPSANALISGISTVPDGTIVELDRINDSGTILSTLTTTTTTGGNYSFNFTKLKYTFSSDLMVRVFNSGLGVQMRAFAGIGTTNINPITEAAVGIVLETIRANPGIFLANFTPQEQNDITASIDLFSTVNNLGSGVDIRSMVTNVKSAILVNSGITSFITAASANGQTTIGPGDIGNYMPVSTGNTWILQDQTDPSSGLQTSYTETDSFTGTTNFNGTAMSVLTVTTTGQSATTIQNYFVKNSTGYFEYGDNDPKDLLLPQISPIIQFIFPIQPGRTFGQINKKELNYGQDLDGDGIPEKFDISYSGTYIGFETSTVLAGSFPNSIRITINVMETITLSTNKQLVVITYVEDLWLAPGVGPVKSILSTQGRYKGSIYFSETDTNELTGFLVNGVRQGLRIEISPSTATIQLNSVQQFAANLFDRSNNPVYGVNFLWNSSNQNVASINSNGSTTANALGNTIITASVGGVVSNPSTLKVIDLRTINLTTNDIIYDPLRQKMYVSIPSTNLNGNTIAVLDPVSGTFESAIKVGTEPTKLTISDDNQYLYFLYNDQGNAVGRLNLNSKSQDLTFAIPNFGSPPLSTDLINIKVLPGSPGSLAVSDQVSPRELAIYDNGILRPNYISRPPLPSGAYFITDFDFSADASVIYALDVSGGLLRLLVDSSGVSLFDVSPFSSFSLFENPTFLKFESGKLYLPLANPISVGPVYPMGGLIDPGTISPNVFPSLTEPFEGPSSARNLVWPDSKSGRLYILSGGTYSIPSSWILFAFDLQTYGLIDSIQIDGVSGFPTSFFRWGARGLAFRTDQNQIFLVNSALVP